MRKVLVVALAFVLLTSCGEHRLDAVLTLTVESAYGNPQPSVGLHTYKCDLTTPPVIEASVESEVVALGSKTRHLCVGWQGEGSVPQNGTSNSLTFALTENSLLRWLWQTQHKVEVSVSPAGGGSVSVSPQKEWYDEGEVVMFQAQPASGYLFSHWQDGQGNILGLQSQLSITVEQPLQIVAFFVDAGQAGQVVITTTTLPDAVEGVSYTKSLSAAGGAPPYSWRLVSGSLPWGLTLSGDGQISGTPLEAARFLFEVEVSDSSNPPLSARASIRLDVHPAAPSNLTVTPKTADAIRLQWSDNSASESGYLIQRNINNTGWVDVARIAPDSTSWHDKNATPGSSVTYRVYATAPGGLLSDPVETPSSVNAPTLFVAGLIGDDDAPTAIACKGNLVVLSWWNNLLNSAILACYDLSERRWRWAKRFSSRIYHLAFCKNMVIAAKSYSIAAFNPDTCQQIWGTKITYKHGSSTQTLDVTGLCATDDGRIFVGSWERLTSYSDENGLIIELDAADGSVKKMWRFSANDGAASIDNCADEIFVTQNTCYILDKRYGTGSNALLWKIDLSTPSVELCSKIEVNHSGLGNAIFLSCLTLHIEGNEAVLASRVRWSVLSQYTYAILACRLKEETGNWSVLWSKCWETNLASPKACSGVWTASNNSTQTGIILFFNPSNGNVQKTYQTGANGPLRPYAITYSQKLSKHLFGFTGSRFTDDNITSTTAPQEMKDVTVIVTPPSGNYILEEPSSNYTVEENDWRGADVSLDPTGSNDYDAAFGWIPK